MQYIISLLEGIITFISPCLLPMLPIYLSYFAGGSVGTARHRTLVNALGFVLGFTSVFTLMGAFAGTIGAMLKEHSLIVNVISGFIVILFGLNYMGVIRISFFKGRQHRMDMKEMGFLTSVIFGMVFSIGWTPCVGAFLGSALMLASQQGSMAEGIIMLLCYSLGLGIPFVVSAVLINHLKSTFDVIKRNYKLINYISGVVLVLVGILMMTGRMGYFLSLLSF